MSPNASTVESEPAFGVLCRLSLGPAVLIAACAFPGCAEPESAQGGSGRSGEFGSPRPAAGAVVLPTVSEAGLPEADVGEPLASQFVVPQQVAHRVALGIAIEKGGLDRAARICASWLRVGPDGAVLASEHVVGSGPGCEGWSGLLEWAGPRWQHPDSPPSSEAPSGAGPDEPDETKRLVDLQLASVGRFFTVAVSAYSFHHPLYEAQQGLPQWVLRAARSERAAVPWRCQPRWVQARADRQSGELASYDCPEGPVAYEHVMGRSRRDVTLRAHAEATAAFRAWQRAVLRQYPEQIDRRIERLARLWDRYDTAGAP